MIFVKKMPGSLGKKILTAWRIICSVLKLKILFMGSGGKKKRFFLQKYRIFIKFNLLFQN